MQNQVKKKCKKIKDINVKEIAKFITANSNTKTETMLVLKILSYYSYLKTKERLLTPKVSNKMSNKLGLCCAKLRLS